MAFKISPQWYTFVRNTKNLAPLRHVEEMYGEFGQDILELVESTVRSKDINWTDTYAESFTANVRRQGAGFGTRIVLSIENEAPHAIFVAYGSNPPKDPKSGPPKDLVTWAQERLGLSRKSAFPVARQIFRAGAHASINSPFRRLTPVGDKGYDPVQELYDSGAIDPIIKQHSEEIGRRIIEEVRRGI